MKNAKS
jgi:hypothetical protein